MLQLEGAKCSFLICLGICMFIGAVIYLMAEGQTEPQGDSTVCGPSKSCQAFIPSAQGSTARQMHGCYVESNLKDQQGEGGEFNCSRLVKELHFITSPLSHEEEDYPLAFIITVHKELVLLVRLLRAIYAPQNVYCIHVDAKAMPAYRKAVERLAGCLPNVFLTSHSETVAYAGFSRLQADINCMKDLVASPMPWRKVVNLCGQDFPIMSNLELVRYLGSKDWRDKNMTPGIKQPEGMRHRTQLRYREVDGSYVAPKENSQKKDDPPHGLQIYFGTAYYALTRGFVEFVLKNQVSRDLLEWSKDTFSPDEHYWVTLNRIKEAPGSDLDGGWSGAVRAIKWREHEGMKHSGCKGRYVRDICVYGPDDLQWIISSNNMFANKFESNSFPEALECLEQWHRDKVLQQTKVPIQSWWELTTHRNVSAIVNATVGL
ncbi:hypothetical protein UPYG_G00162680 [Umbra pygmaea]|uniref:Beta-1,3-galactosyl-O-glycosyl-glycoprotein beta-1,6-N-acetylglucosaminyltransferase 7 n=1 Tax=Umbra pygmaea TaxID=75934 RepID=A0ABD0WLY7_UMBPY